MNWSAISGEFIAVSDLFLATTIALELSRLFERRIPVQVLTDGKFLFDGISRGSRTPEKRMKLDIAAARDCFKNKIISDIGFVCSDSNIVDELTKRMHQHALQELLSDGRLTVCSGN